MKLEYTFEKMSSPTHVMEYQVRLNGEFVCYSNHTNPEFVDNYLKREGFNSREEYLEACMDEIEEMF